MTPGLLSAHQLCDLLNYVLGLPEVMGKKTVLKPAIQPWVVGTWRKKPTRNQLESWCDEQLSRAGLKPLGRKSAAGNRVVLPREINHWLPDGMRRPACS